MFQLDLSQQGKMLAGFINLMLEASAEKEYLMKLEKVAESHYNRGVTSFEYTPFGEVI
jgi:hypothetical protein